MNLRVCAGLPQTRDEPSWGEGEASRSTCLRVVDSGEDPELQEDEASRSDCLRVDDSGEVPKLHETLGVSSTNPLTENV